MNSEWYNEKLHYTRQNIKFDPLWSLHLSNKVRKLKNASDNSEVQILVIKWTSDTITFSQTWLKVWFMLMAIRYKTLECYTETGFVFSICSSSLLTLFFRVCIHMDLWICIMVVCRQLLIPQWSCLGSSVKHTVAQLSFIYFVYARGARAWLSEGKEWQALCLHPSITGKGAALMEPKNSELLLCPLVLIGLGYLILAQCLTCEDNAENTTVDLWCVYRIFIIWEYRFDPDQLWAHALPLHKP